MLHRHPFLSLTTLAYLGFVGWVTLTPGSEAPTSSDLVLRVLARLQRYDELSWLTYDRAEHLANVALFVPVGVFLLLLFGTRLWWLAAGRRDHPDLADRDRAAGRCPAGSPTSGTSPPTRWARWSAILLGLVLTLPATLRRWRDEDEFAASADVRAARLSLSVRRWGPASPPAARIVAVIVTPGRGS